MTDGWTNRRSRRVMQPIGRPHNNDDNGDSNNNNNNNNTHISTVLYGRDLICAVLASVSRGNDNDGHMSVHDGQISDGHNICQ